MLSRNLAYYIELCVFMIGVVTAKVFADVCLFPPLPDVSLGSFETTRNIEKSIGLVFGTRQGAETAQ